MRLELEDAFSKDILEYAMKRRQYEMIRVLLRAGISLGASGARGKKMLFSACKLGDLETVSVLLERGLTVSTINSESGDSCLQCALEGDP